MIPGVLDRIAAADLVQRTGRITRIFPTYFEASGPAVALGAICHIEAYGDERVSHRHVVAQVVSIDRKSIRLVSLEPGSTTFPGARVVAVSTANLVGVGNVFLGRAVDALGRPLDGEGPLQAEHMAPLDAPLTAPLDRTSPTTVMTTGLRAIDGLMPLGRGQRIGIFAAAGAGKTTLLTQLANQVDCDCCVIGLVGERGREVEALWSHGLKGGAKAKTALIAATSDQSAVLRVRAVSYSVALAEHWRAQGRHVMLLLDSVTRLALALREIGLAAGEPPTVRAYTPSVFAAMPQLIERCGALRAGGSITAVMTVLSDTDEVDDPICEMMKSLLDGHIVLSRSLAEEGHYPAIDVPRSISRLAPSLMQDRHRADAAKARKALSQYDGAKTLVETGLYSRGANAEIDLAIDLRPPLMDFLKQAPHEQSGLAASTQALAAIVNRKAA